MFKSLARCSRLIVYDHYLTPVAYAPNEVISTLLINTNVQIHPSRLYSLYVRRSGDKTQRPITCTALARTHTPLFAIFSLAINHIVQCVCLFVRSSCPASWLLLTHCHLFIHRFWPGSPLTTKCNCIRLRNRANRELHRVRVMCIMCMWLQLKQMCAPLREAR